jgi:predicted porin
MNRRDPLMTPARNTSLFSGFCRLAGAWTLALPLALAGANAHAQADYSLYGVLDLSYGRFEPSGTIRENRFNSNSLTATFVGVNAKYGFENGWTPGITLETFYRFQDLQTGRSQRDPHLSRNAFVSLQNNSYGLLRAGRLQSLLFDTTIRFNALGNAVAFSPSVRHVFAAGNLGGVQGDFYWNQAVGYTSPKLDDTWFESTTANLIVARGESDRPGRLTGASVVTSIGLWSGALSLQRVRIDADALNDLTNETTWQLGTTYNFGFARVFGQLTRTNDRGLGVKSTIATAGAAVPAGPGTAVLQAAQTRAEGDAVDRKHTTGSVGYLYPYDSVTDFYALFMDDRVRGQTVGRSAAAGVRWRF